MSLGDNMGMDVPSPCIDVCSLDDKDICLGCGRHIDEIVAWSNSAPEVKLRVVAVARERLATMKVWPPSRSAQS
ncbi:MAG: hypothetical protein JWR07_3225 [Nevskia sp.]|nr:hypothetical protein [Nevskia sp.]